MNNAMRSAQVVPEALIGKVAFVDASAMVALADHDDVSHAAAVDGYRDLIESGFSLVTSEIALAEAFQLVSAALGEDVARSWLEHCEIEIQLVTHADIAAARRSILSGTFPPGVSLTAAIHLAFLDRLEITDVFAVDRSFLSLLG